MVHHSLWLELSQDNLPFQVYSDEKIRMNQQIDRILRQNLTKTIELFKVSQKYLRVTLSRLIHIEAKKNLFIRLMEGVACTHFKIKFQICLTLQLASNNFTCLK